MYHSRGRKCAHNVGDSKSMMNAQQQVQFSKTGHFETITNNVNALRANDCDSDEGRARYLRAVADGKESDEDKWYNLQLNDTTVIFA